jgi:hypothetical protein
MKTIAILLLLLILIFLIYNHIQVSKVYINKTILDNSKLNSELRLTQISDYHNNTKINEKKLLKEIEYFNPNMILLTGDIIDSKTKDLNSTLDLIEKIKAINPKIYFVRGNHEIGNKYEDEFIYRLKEIGINVLDNENQLIILDGEKINVCGVSFYINRKDYEKSLEGIDEKNFTLMLSHSPNRPMMYSKGLEDLILSGHTHGGQVRLPIIGAMIVPGQGFFPKYTKGIYKLENTILYIDSGLGNSLLPLRLFNRVQISNIIIKPIDN